MFYHLQPYKMYPRDWIPTGRIRVEIEKADGTLVCPEIRNSEQQYR